mmetsp:Transcript_16530/g.29444  ORF Transcript_16530/g.29444 Transcript_16530/m.29444 type:complete len:269 (+) Transcript_16530:6939-7745(+)
MVAEYKGQITDSAASCSAPSPPDYLSLTGVSVAEPPHSAGCADLYFEDAFCLSLSDLQKDLVGGNFAIPCLPFSWKFSLVPCQRILQSFLKALVKGQTFVPHYLGDLMVSGLDKALVAEVTKSLVAILVEKGCLISPKSKLDPVQEMQCSEKSLEIKSGKVSNTDRALSVVLAKWLVLARSFCTRKRVQSAIGKLRWLARPHDFLSLVMAGLCAHVLWGPKYLPFTPVAMLSSPGSVLALSYTGRIPLPYVLTRVWDLRNFVFVDAAM